MECDCWQCSQGKVKSGDVGKPERERWQQWGISEAPCQNMLSTWQKPRLNMKSSRTLHPAVLTFPPRQPNETQTYGCPRRETCPQWCWKVYLDGMANQAAWKEHYERHSNVEFDWDPDCLTEVYPMEGWDPASHLSWWSRPSSWWNVARLPSHPCLLLKCWKPLELKGLSRSRI